MSQRVWWYITRQPADEHQADEVDEDVEDATDVADKSLGREEQPICQNLQQTTSNNNKYLQSTFYKSYKAVCIFSEYTQNYNNFTWHKSKRVFNMTLKGSRDDACRM